ncbi:plasma membrane protein Pth11-like protein [Nemania sp. NC0429]|nr:plasma membrane protein Pth11-like protein [Nemania sp. NC0429]
MAVDQKYYQTPGHLVAAAVLFPVLDIVAVTLRIRARMKQKQPLKADDWLILPATLLTIGLGIAIVYGVSTESVGYVTKIPDNFDGNTLMVQTDQLTLNSQIEWAFNMILPLLLGCIKGSFLFFYKRIFSVHGNSAINIILNILIIMVFAWAVAFCFAFIFFCRLNFFAIWGTFTDLIMYCPGSMNLVLALCITDFVVDVIVIIFPVPLIWRLNLPRNKKLAISAVFLLGIIAVVASLARLVVVAKIVRVGFNPNEDGALAISGYLYWGVVECSISVLAASLPSLQILFRGWSWVSFSTSLKSILRYNMSKSQVKISRNDEIYVGHGYDVAYDSNNGLSESQLVRHTLSFSTQYPEIGTETYIMHELPEDKSADKELARR